MPLKIRYLNSTASALALLAVACLVPYPALAQASPFMTGATSLQTNILAWLTPVAIILVMVLGAMAMANRMLKSLAARIAFAPKDFADAREISDELGFTTIPVRTVSKPLGPTFERRGQRGRSQTLSDQRRALLLPQEVKELGTEDAIVFCEGLRPIRCRKIRYFNDWRFRRRLIPPPRAPTPHNRPNAVTLAPVATAMSAQLPDSRGAAGTELKPEKTEAPVIREATTDDIERIESLTLEDFATQFPEIQSPEREGPMTDEEMQSRVQGFMNSIKRDRGGDYAR